MLEVEDLDTVGRAFDDVKASDAVRTTLGKHTNDHMVSFYCNAPSGLTIEYGTAGRLIDDETWVVGYYTATSYWGHAAQQAPA